ncbi:hypothetical protein D3C84_875070 [compost metagenome]
MRRQDTVDFCQCVLNGAGQAFIGLAADPLCAGHQRLDLFLGKTQRRQQKTRAQDVANAGFANDVRPHRLQRDDVPPDGTQRHIQLTGQRDTGNRPAMAPKDLHEVE